jgi:hypothetical protein
MGFISASYNVVPDQTYPNTIRSAGASALRAGELPGGLESDGLHRSGLA